MFYCSSIIYPEQVIDHDREDSIEELLGRTNFSNQNRGLYIADNMLT